MRLIHLKSCFVLSVMALVLSACGGGGSTPPPPTTTLPAAPELSASSATVTVTLPSGSNLYRLYRSTTADSGFRQIYFGSTLGYPDTNFNAGTVYYYRFTSCTDSDPSSCSVDSAAGSVTTVPATPVTPVGSAQSDSRVDISWAFESGASMYRVYRATNTPTNFVQIHTATSGLSLGYVDETASADTTYYYTISACSGSTQIICSAPSPAIAATTGSTSAPDAPAIPAAIAQSASQINISWTATTGATTYRLYRSTSGVTATIYTGGALQYSDTGLTANTSYRYQLDACSSAAATADRCSAQSAATTATTGIIVIAASTPTVSVQGANQIDISWTAPSTSTSSYRLYRSLSADRDFSQISDNASLNHNDTGLNAGTTYYYRLRACDVASNCSEQSPAVSGTTNPAAPAAAPIVSVFSADRVDISWASVTGAAFYQLQRSTAADSDFSQIHTATSGSSLNYSDTNLAAGVDYRYRVLACVSEAQSSCSAPSSANSATTNLSPPAAPSLRVQTGLQVDVSWAAVTGTSSYRLYRSTLATSGFSEIATATIGASLNHSDTTGLSANTLYYYRVSACTSDTLSSCSVQSSAASVTTNPPAPAAPTLGVRAGLQIDVSWSPVTGASSYLLYRSLSADSNFSPIFTASSGSSLSYSDTGVTQAATAYYYQLRACAGDTLSNCSDLSATSTATTNIMAPSAPTLAVQGASQIDVSWTAVAGMSHYRLFRSLSETDGFERLTLSANTATSGSTLMHSDTGLSAGTTYYYRLRACTSEADNSCSEQSDPSSATTLPVTPDAPILSVQSDLRIDVSWPSVTGANTYRLYRALTESGDFTKTVYAATSTTYSDTSLSAGTTYYYRLSACHSEQMSSCSEQSPASNETTRPAAPPAPTLRVLSSSQIEISWSAVTGTSSYRLYRSLSDEDSGFSPVSEGASLSHTDTGLNAGTTYYYQLQACQSDTLSSCSARSTPSSAKTNLATPAAPSVSVQTGLQIDVSWTVVTGASRYQLYRSQSADSGFSVIYTATSGTVVNHSDVDVAADTTYYYRLSACLSADVSSCSERSAVTNATTNLSAPAMPDLNVQSASQVNISWASVTGASRYRLYRSLSEDSGFSLTADVADLSHSDEGLNANTTYYYQLQACKGDTLNSCSLHSTASRATTKLATPAAPSLSVRVGLQIDVSWSAVTGTSSYRVYRSQVPEISGFSQVHTITGGTRVLDTGLSADTAYFYLLRACSGDALSSCSDASATSTATTNLIAPGAPELSVESASQINVSWSAVTDTISYRVYRSTFAASDFTQVHTVTSGTSVNDTSLSANTSYYYLLRACKADDLNSCSEQSGTSTAATQLAPPSAPAVAVMSGVRVQASWSAVTDAQSYQLYRSTSATGTFSEVDARTAATSVIDTNLSANTAYYYKLAACKGDATSADSLCSAQSDASVAVTTNLAAPAAPSVAVLSGLRISASWGDVTGAGSYRLYRSISATGTFSAVDARIAGTSLIDTGVSADTPYYYKLVACKGDTASSDDLCSAQSPASAAVTTNLAAPSAPSVAVLSGLRVAASWSETTGADSYQLYRAISATGTFSAVKTQTASASLTDDTDLSARTNYYYKVTACRAGTDGRDDANLCSVQSPASAAVTTNPAAPSTPSLIVQSMSQIDVDWGDVADATLYRLERMLSGSAAGQVYSDTASFYSDRTGLVAGNSYAYRARACTASDVNHCSEYSSFSAVKTIPRFTAPTLDVSFSQVKRFDFSWTQTVATDVSYYELTQNPDGISGFSSVATITASSLTHSLEVPLHLRTNAQYIVSACSASDVCFESDQLAISGNLADAVGYFKASNANDARTDDDFGGSIAISADGTTLAVGAPSERGRFTTSISSPTNSGAVYLFEKISGSWSQTAYLKASNVDADDRFGTSVALNANGSVLFVGAPEEDSGATGINGDQGNGVGDQLNTGAIYVFEKDGSDDWNQEAYIKASIDDATRIGLILTISADGNAFAVGDPSDGRLGVVYLFERDSAAGAWTQSASVRASNAGGFDQFGSSVSMGGNGTVLAVGAFVEDGGDIDDPSSDTSLNSGAVYLFEKLAGGWTETTYLKASDLGAEDRFGEQVSLSFDGNTLAVGAVMEDDSAENSGAVYLFERPTDGDWAQTQKLKASNASEDDEFGSRVSLSADGTVLAVGVQNEDGDARGIGGSQNDLAGGSGAVYVFKKSGSTWSQSAYVKASNTDANDHFGVSVSLSEDGSTLAVGADQEDSEATGIGGDQGDGSTNSGAVYLY